MLNFYLAHFTYTATAVGKLLYSGQDTLKTIYTITLWFSIHLDVTFKPIILLINILAFCIPFQFFSIFLDYLIDFLNQSFSLGYKTY